MDKRDAEPRVGGQGDQGEQCEAAATWHTQVAGSTELGLGSALQRPVSFPGAGGLLCPLSLPSPWNKHGLAGNAYLFGSALTESFRLALAGIQLQLASCTHSNPSGKIS